MKTTEDLSQSHMRNVVAEQAHNLEAERLREKYEQVEEHDLGDFQLVVTSMNYGKFAPVFKEVK
jgi:hypothetical protein